MQKIDTEYASGLRLSNGLTLNELLTSLEEDDYDQPNNEEIVITMLPPTNACQDLTDEDSGEEDNMSPNNLPGSQLRAEVEVNRARNDDLSDDEDEISLASLRTAIRKTYSWEKTELQRLPTEWPTFYDVNPNYSATELFLQFFDESIIDMFVTYSNMYAAKRNRVPNINRTEIKVFFGILLLSGYVEVPRRRMYWENSCDTHNELVSSAMSRDRFEYIMSNLHCCDNDNLSQEDRFTKVRPLLKTLNKNFQAFAPVCQEHSVDESMVPYFGRHGCKQFIKGKPIRYGFKMWMGAISSSGCNGYCVWFEPYQGAKTQTANTYRPFGLGPSIILHYSDVLSNLQKLPYSMFFDNFFTSIPLMEELLKKNIRATGTIRENRLKNCPLVSKSEMKKTTRGSYDFRTTNNKITIVKWNDNNIVNVATNNLGIRPTHMTTRLSKKRKVIIEPPYTIRMYNAFMGGVDRCDENISYYRTSIRGKKWYFCIIAYCIDLAIQNAWHRHRLQGGALDHLTFRRQITMTLLETNKSFKKRGRPSSLENIESRFNSENHYLVRQDKQTRCRECHKKVQKKCIKCNVALHMECFVDYHKKN